jgi:hypothetical protein
VLLGGLRRVSLGIAIGTFLAWLNYRWLEQGADALARIAIAQEGSDHARVPLRVYVKVAGRYVLIGLVAYASVSYLDVPLVAIIYGLLALGAAAIVGSLYEVIWDSNNA